VLAVLFRIGESTFAIDSSVVERVVPALPLRAVPGATQAVVGICEHQGVIIPVVDLCLAIIGLPARPQLSTRYIICRLPEARTLALIAERVTETCEVNEADLQEPGVHSEGAPYLGKIFHDAAGELVQCGTPHGVLPALGLAALQLTA